MARPAYDIDALQLALDEALGRAEAAEVRARIAEERADAAEARALRADTHTALAEARARKLRETARRYRTVLANIPDTFVAVFDTDLRYQVYEGRIPRGHNSEEVIGLRPSEVFPARTGAAIEDQVRRTLNGHAFKRELPLDDKQFIIHFRPLHDVDGSISGAMGLWQEVTTLKQTEDALRRKSDALQAAVDQREVLLREVYHRVKNNLQVVSSLISLQARALQDEAAAAALRTTRQRIAAMARVHEQLYRSRDLARIDLGAYVHQLVAELVTTYRRDSSIRVQVDAPGVHADLDVAISYGLILHELVANALQHAWPEGGPGLLEVGLHREGTELILDVADDGIGSPTPPSHNTLGTRLVASLAAQIGGAILRVPGTGTHWRLRSDVGGPA